VLSCGTAGTGRFELPWPP